MTKPFELRFLETKQTLIDCINSSISNNGISYIIMESLLQDIYRQVSQGAKIEKEALENQYKQSLCVENINEKFEDITDKIDNSEDEEKF